MCRLIHCTILYSLIKFDQVSCLWWPFWKQSCYHKGYSVVLWCAFFYVHSFESREWCATTKSPTMTTMPCRTRTTGEYSLLTPSLEKAKLMPRALTQGAREHSSSSALSEQSQRLLGNYRQKPGCTKHQPHKALLVGLWQTGLYELVRSTDMS